MAVGDVSRKICQHPRPIPPTPLFFCVSSNHNEAKKLTGKYSCIKFGNNFRLVLGTSDVLHLRCR